MSRSLLLMAAFSVTWTEIAAAAITFTSQSPTRGHRIHQTVDVRTKANVVFEQSQQVIFDENRDERNRQQRDVEVLETGPDPPTLARVTYAKATTKELNQLGHRATPQPVAGKTYLVARVDGELQVTYPDGRQPPRDEWAIVAANMRSLGKPNPLAQFLNGRTVQIGEQLTLPPHIAKELLGESVRFQEADRITLRLRPNAGSQSSRAGGLISRSAKADRDSGRPLRSLSREDRVVVVDLPDIAHGSRRGVRRHGGARPGRSDLSRSPSRHGRIDRRRDAAAVHGDIPVRAQENALIAPGPGWTTTCLAPRDHFTGSLRMTIYGGTPALSSARTMNVTNLPSFNNAGSNVRSQSKAVAKVAIRTVANRVMAASGPPMNTLSPTPAMKVVCSIAVAH